MFSGTLDDFTLPEILRMLAFSKKSGTLHVSRQAGTGSVAFRAGDVVYAETELSSSLLGQKLVGAGKITPAQLRQGLDVQATSGERLGRILLASESVTEADLQNALRSQVEEAAYELMCWDAGDFSWEPGAEEPDTEISIDVEELMRDVEGRIEQRAEVQLRLSKAGAIPRMVEQAPHGPGDINIRPEQWRVMVLVDGRRTIGELAVAAGVAEVDVLRTLNELALVGLVEVQEEAVAAPVAPETTTGPASESSARGATEAPAFEAAAASTASPVDPAVGTGPPEEWFEDPESSDAEGEPVAFPPPEAAEDDLPRVDRAAAVRELAGLFDEPKASPRPPPPPAGPPPKDPETKSRLSRLTRRSTPSA